MRRYFDLIGKKQCAELVIADGSPASKAKSESFKEYFKCDVREIGRLEYEKLKNEYSEPKEGAVKE